MTYECKICGKICKNVFEAAYHARLEHKMQLPKADFQKAWNYYTRHIRAGIVTGAEVLMYMIIILLKAISFPGHLIYRRLQ